VAAAISNGAINLPVLFMLFLPTFAGLCREALPMVAGNADLLPLRPGGRKMHHLHLIRAWDAMSDSDLHAGFAA
jgi:hypothetical protein